MIVNELYKLENLNKKATMLLNMIKETREFYDNYMFNQLSWLLDNEERINNDFKKYLNDLEFVVINSDLEERVNLILALKNKGIEEFSKYITSCPFEYISIKLLNDIRVKFDLFKSITDDYQAIVYFDRIRRR